MQTSRRTGLLCKGTEQKRKARKEIAKVDYESRNRGGEERNSILSPFFSIWLGGNPVA